MIRTYDNAADSVMQSIKAAIESQSDELFVKQIKLLETIKDCGFLSAVTLMCEIGDFSVFSSPKKLYASWTAWSVRRILQNEKYCGDLLLQKSFRENHITKRQIYNSGQLPQFYVEGAHEPIIDKATFLAVQKLMKENQRFTPSTPTTNTYPLTGILHCG